MESYVATACSDERVELGEGARWDGVGQRLLCVSIAAGRLFCAEFRNGRLVTTDSAQVPGYLGAVAPLDSSGGGWIIAAHEGFAHLAVNGTFTRAGRARSRPGRPDPDERRGVRSGRAVLGREHGL